MKENNPEYLKIIKFHFDRLHKYNPLFFGPILLNQVGDVICDFDFELGVHEQECYEVTYVVAGEGTILGGGKYYKISQGHLFISPLGDLHNISSDNKNPLRFFYCGFDFDKNHSDYASVRAIKELMDMPGIRITTDRYNLYSIFSNIFNEYMGQNVLREKIMQALIIQLLCYTYRNVVEATPLTYAPIERKSNADILFFGIVQYLEQHILSIRHLKEISDHFGYTYSYISQIFSQRLNITLKKHFNNLKISKTKEFLDHNMSVTEISDMFGYSSIHAFSRFFRQHTGMTSTEYKEKTAQLRASEQTDEQQEQ